VHENGIKSPILTIKQLSKVKSVNFRKKNTTVAVGGHPRLCHCAKEILVIEGNLSFFKAYLLSNILYFERK
jgi:hypothetical protein